jgi:predicted dehydrogenase
MPEQYRVAVIGGTGRGAYGHGLDTVWADVPNTQLVAVADDKARGLAQAEKRLRVKGYGDHRRMLDEARPGIVTIGPRWLGQRHAMVLAAAERGVHVYLEKPMCQTLAEADQMVASCEKHNVKLAIAFPTRYSPILPVIRDIIDSGQIGQVLKYRARGKEDRRGGGEDLWVLGTHRFNLIHHFAGDPIWCFASVREGGEPIRKKDVKPGAEEIGLLAGDSVQACYRMADGATAYFNSNRSVKADRLHFRSNRESVRFPY